MLLSGLTDAYVSPLTVAVIQIAGCSQVQREQQTYPVEYMSSLIYLAEPVVSIRYLISAAQKLEMEGPEL